MVRPKTGVRLLLADLFRFPEVPERPRLALSLLLLPLLLLPLLLLLLLLSSPLL